MARNRQNPQAVLIDPPSPYHADFSQSLDEQGLGLSAVPPFLIGGRRLVDAEAAAATHFSAVMVVGLGFGLRTSIGDRPSAARPS